MPLNIPAKQNTVQIVMTLETLEAVLAQFPRLEVFPVAHDPNDLPTYAFKVKGVPVEKPERRPFIPRVPRRSKQRS